MVDNISTVNQILDQSVQESVRVIARGIMSKNVYSLRGGKDALGMKDSLTQRLIKQGCVVKRVIITNVKLAEQTASSMQSQSIFQFKNTLERKTFAFQQRTKNDKEEEAKARQIHEEQRKDEEELSNLAQLKKNKDVDTIKAQIKRIKNEWRAKTDAKIDQIDAETELKVSEIIAEANLIETQIVSEAQAKAIQMIAEADAYEATTVANARAKVAPMIAEAVRLEGDAEKQLQKAFVQKRTHDEIM